MLDVGPGRGARTLRLARAGHLVTGLESDPALLAALRDALAAEPEGIRGRVTLIEGDGGEAGRHFGPGSFDVAMCHKALPYVPEDDVTLAALARVVAPEGLLSLVVPNGDALAMRPALLGDWAGALAALGPGPARPDQREALAATLRSIGLPLGGWYGVRVFTDGADDAATLPQDPRERERLLAAEELAGRTDPYRSVAALLHLIAARA